MKKSCLLIVALAIGLIAQAASYGILVNSKTYYAGTANANPGDPSFQEYMVRGVSLKAGDKCQLYDKDNNAAWTVPLDTWSTSDISEGSGVYVIGKAACYDFYIKLKYGEDQLYVGGDAACTGITGVDVSSTIPDPPTPIVTDIIDASTYKPADCSSAVPSQCPDVMLQAFYWDSYKGGTHGNTKWSTLTKSAGEIAAYFDLIWLPPSGKATGGVGYLPLQYSNQDSDWGKTDALNDLIKALHSGGSKVVADIVVNHVAGKSWCTFYDLDFGQYGQFQPKASWICSTDEMNYDDGAGACKGKATGAADDGYGSEANYEAGRDWDHNNATVRDMCKAYLKWMKNEMLYDGFRYDYCKGFHNSHIGDYNSAAKTYFSVMEYWDGNPDVLQSHLNDAGWNTLTFDFATKYTAFNNGIAGFNYGGCKGCGLLGAGKAKYAVTFVDSHDSYQRDGNEFGGQGNSMTAELKDRLLQANAFMLAMPGVPCVFYPHWKEYKAEIAPMVAARHNAGVHSESSVSDEGDNSGYRATVQGKNGSLILELGNRVSTSQSGYTKAASGNGYAIWVKLTKAVAPRLAVSPISTSFKTTSMDITIDAFGGSESATIYYTTDGSDPRTSTTRHTYTAGITITQTTTVKACAETAGGSQSAVYVNTYTYKAPQTTPIKIAILKPASWSKVCLYAWNADGVAYNGRYPGNALTDIDENGMYYLILPAEAKEVNFLFGNGNDVKSGNLWTDEDVCYMWNGSAKKLDDCTQTPLIETSLILQNSTRRFFENGHLFIETNGQVYDMMGNRVR